MNQKLQPQEEKSEKAYRLGRWFGRKHAAENVETVAEVTPTQSEVEEARVAGLIAELQQAVRKRERNLRIGQIACWISVLLIPLPSLFALTWSETSYGSHTDLFVKLMEVGTSISLAACMFGIAAMFRGVLRLKQAMAAAADIEDMRAAGPLAEALRSANTAVQVTAAVTLNRLLPRLRSRDFDLLDHKQHTCLYRALRASANPRSVQYYNPEFAVTVVRALEHIGDAKAIPILGRLAKSAKDVRVRSAAAECLPVLKTRLGANNVGAALFDSAEEMEAQTENAPAHAPSESIESLMRQLQAAHTRKRDYPIGIAGIILGIILIFADLATEAVRQGSRNPVLGFIPGEIVVGASILFLRYRASGTRGVTTALSATDDLRVVGLLASALEMGDPWTQAMAAQALTRLLPRLQASDTDLLNDEQRACLCRTLDHIGKHKINRQDADFAVSALKALEQLGDGKSLPTVEALTRMKVKTPADGRIRDAATYCLPFLQERAEQQRAEETLLRAASASETPPEVLLRPAASAPVADTERLLRPGTSPDESGHGSPKGGGKFGGT